jgi:BMFP domain-containing protein YqiC
MTGDHPMNIKQLERDLRETMQALRDTQGEVNALRHRVEQLEGKAAKAGTAKPKEKPNAEK